MRSIHPPIEDGEPGFLADWSHPPGLNRRPTVYETVALPAELGWPRIPQLYKIMAVSFRVTRSEILVAKRRYC
jgi:hypothetical protein